MRVSLMMAIALFPDAVSYQYVPGPRVTVGDPKEFLAALRSRDREKMLEINHAGSEQIELEIITEDPPWVMVGMSKRYNRVFIYEEEADYSEYE